MKAIKYINETPSATVAPYLTKYFVGTAEASIAASVERYRAIDAWSKDLTMSEASFNRLQDIIDNAGELEKRMEMTKLVDNSYASKIAKEVYTN